MITLKFLVDECVGLLVAHWLKENGLDTISIVAEMPGISDDEVLAKAFLENRILITSRKFKSEGNNSAFYQQSVKTFYLVY